MEQRQNSSRRQFLGLAGGAAVLGAIPVFNEKNPQANIANFHLGPHNGRAQVSTRIRLADSQKIVAIAKLSDGSFWSASVDVVVTLAACTEDVI